MRHLTNPATAKGKQRKASIIKAAKKVFIEYGFENATLEKIIEISGGSRSTLYQHFGDKEGLYIAVIHDTIESIFSNISDIDEDTPLENVLKIHGEHFLKSILAPDTLSLFRLVIAEIDRFPKLGELFYKIGPEKTYTIIAEALEKFSEFSSYSKSSLYQLSSHFIEMLKGELFMKALCIKDYVVTNKSIEESVNLSVSFTLYLLHNASSYEKHTPKQKSDFRD